MYLERLNTINVVDVKFYKGGAICSVPGETTLITFVDLPHANGALEPLVATSLPIPNSSDTFFQASPIVSVTSGGTQSIQTPGVFSIPSTRNDYVCNKRGTCDYSTGNCTCFDHFHSSQGNMMNMRGSEEYQVPGVYGGCGYWDGTELTKCPRNPTHNLTDVCSGAKHKCLDDFTCNCTGEFGSSCSNTSSVLHMLRPTNELKLTRQRCHAPCQATRVTLANIRLAHGRKHGLASQRRSRALTGTRLTAHSEDSVIGRRGSVRALVLSVFTKVLLATKWLAPTLAGRRSISTRIGTTGRVFRQQSSSPSATEQGRA